VCLNIGFSWTIKAINFHSINFRTQKYNAPNALASALLLYFNYMVFTARMGELRGQGNPAERKYFKKKWLEPPLGKFS
jgi:hypothetical protein